MPLKNKKVTTKAFSVTSTTKEQIDELMLKLDCLSASEVVRRAVSFMHSKTFKDYLYNRSANDIEKRRKLQGDIEQDGMSDMEFAEKYIGGGLICDTPQGEFYVIHSWGNFLQPLSGSEVRDVVSEDKGLVKLHQEKAIKTLVQDCLTPSMVKYIKTNYNIDLSDYIVETN